MSQEYLTTRELAELLRIKERKVYDLAASGTVPCSKATGKLLFPREAVNAWLASYRTGPQVADLEAVPQVFLGSHDPLLDWALRESQCGIATYFDGSEDGIQRFVKREGLACGLHLINQKTAGWNTEMIESQCAGMPVVLIEWAKRQRGLIFRPDMQPAPESLQDLSQLSITPRQTGAGAQALLVKLMDQQGLDPASFHWASAVRTEDEAALSVLDAKADVAFGLQPLALKYRLQFVPLIEERFDLLLTRKAWFDEPMQRFIHFCRSEQFIQHAAELAGYNVSELGRVHYNGPG